MVFSKGEGFKQLWIIMSMSCIVCEDVQILFNMLKKIIFILHDFNLEYL
jgi:hypothetical protein